MKRTLLKDKKMLTFLEFLIKKSKERDKRVAKEIEADGAIKTECPRGCAEPLAYIYKGKVGCIFCGSNKPYLTVNTI